VEVAQRYVKAMGGADAAVDLAEQAFAEGDYRWCVELLNHVLFADESHARARALQAGAMEQIAFGTECGTWRNAFLSGAHELREGNFGTPTAVSADMLSALTPQQWLTSLALRVDGPRAWNERLQIGWRISDDSLTILSELRNGVLTSRAVSAIPSGVTTFTLDRATLAGLLTNQVDFAEAQRAGRLQVEGDPSVLLRLVSLVAPPDPGFSIVTP
jgi:alkyl sulfatase BDS1-like metallo-beta-lactamase superfamily hydrolase